MGADRLTRRSLLAAAAGAAASGLVRPGSVLAALAAPSRPTLEGRWLGWLAPGGATIALTRVADLVGVEWQAPADARIELRFRRADGRWSRWVSAGPHGHGPDRPGARDRLVGEPVWTGGTTAVQLRSTRTLTGVRLHLVDVSGGVGARRQALGIGPLAAVAALPRATPVLAAGPGQPPIIARRAWAQGMAPPRVTPEYGAVQMAFVHHTENPNGYTSGEVPAMLLAIYAFHRYVNGWNDIGYNFVIDLYGRIFEARAGGIDEPVVGAHAGGYNLVFKRRGGAGLVHEHADLGGRTQRIGTAARVEAVAARRPSRRERDREGQSGGGLLQPLSRERPRVAAADRGPPGRRLDGLSGGRAVWRAAGHPRGRAAAGAADGTGDTRAGAVAPRRAGSPRRRRPAGARRAKCARSPAFFSFSTAPRSRVRRSGCRRAR